MGRRGKKGGKGKKTKGKKTRRNNKKQTNKQRNKSNRNKDCFPSIFKDFNKNQNRERQAKRILGWVKKMDNKKEKALTTFESASIAIIAATNNGTECDGGPVPGNVSEAVEKLPRCNTTASALCSKDNIVGLNTSLAEECNTTTSAYVTAFKAC